MNVSKLSDDTLIVDITANTRPYYEIVNYKYLLDLPGFYPRNERPPKIN